MRAHACTLCENVGMRTRLHGCRPHANTVRSAACILLLVSGLEAQVPATDAGNPRELGKVRWLRDHDEALATSKKTQKPVFLLFQEVPG